MTVPGVDTLPGSALLPSESEDWPMAYELQEWRNGDEDTDGADGFPTEAGDALAARVETLEDPAE